VLSPCAALDSGDQTRELARLGRVELACATQRIVAQVCATLIDQAVEQLAFGPSERLGMPDARGVQRREVVILAKDV
jgi:hypothetical protein